MIVGAREFTNGETNEGRAFVFHGSSTGLPATANWTAEDNQASAWFGGSVASAGDVNGDGFDDVIVGARFFDNPEVDEGRAYMYYGGGQGLQFLPRQRRGDDSAPMQVIGLSSGPEFRFRINAISSGGRTQVRPVWLVAPLGS